MRSRLLGDGVDTHVADVSERFIRRVSRREALRTGVLGGVGTIAALAVGAKPARANTTCHCGPTSRCGTYGHSCPSNGCPSGMKLCKNSGASCSCLAGGYNRQGYCCEYSSGYWIACTGFCAGYGYKVCYDCKGYGCDQWCTCLSDVLCCGCTTPAEVEAEYARQEAVIAG